MMDDLVASSESRRRFVLMVLQIFAALALSLAAIGLVVGAITSTLATRALDALLLGVSRLDPVVYLGTSALVGVIAVAACALPAARASRVDPREALRME